MEPLSKRIATILTQKPKKAQMEGKEEPKGHPVAKVLDHLFESLSDDDTVAALDVLYHLTKILDLEGDVAFDIPQEKGEEEVPKEEGDHHTPFLQPTDDDEHETEQSVDEDFKH